MQTSCKPNHCAPSAKVLPPAPELLGTGFSRFPNLRSLDPELVSLKEKVKELASYGSTDVDPGICCFDSEYCKFATSHKQSLNQPTVLLLAVVLDKVTTNQQYCGCYLHTTHVDRVSNQEGDSKITLLQNLSLTAISTPPPLDLSELVEDLSQRMRKHQNHVPVQT
ncbi:uncharacterized protein LOC128736358 [Sabethes cyaneus]|uniref:uncharacterized protein LOC128736358 n=1 Tax=Sabethes cyaneus TaxID=53552 RepID=UPI00237E6323|nr:uncharacterized protein LOC128736358 [Sabethes cyaneus]